MEVTDKLGDQESYDFPKGGLGKKAIEEIICKWMQERRRKENDPLSSHSDQDSRLNTTWKSKKLAMKSTLMMVSQSLLVTSFINSIQLLLWYTYLIYIISIIIKALYNNLHYYNEIFTG